MKKLLIDDVAYHISTREIMFIIDAARLIGMEVQLASEFYHKADRLLFLINEEPLYFIGGGLPNKQSSPVCHYIVKECNLSVQNNESFMRIVLGELIKNGGSKDETEDGSETDNDVSDSTPDTGGSDEPTATNLSKRYLRNEPY